MLKVKIPPLKIQGIKSKLVPSITHLALPNIDKNTTWVEPFMGSGVVGFNMSPQKVIFADTNKDIITFYQSIQQGTITPQIVYDYLQKETLLLACQGESYYKLKREQFNEERNPLDFLFLNRSCFNGMMRYNSKGKFNVPYCHKNERFSKAYITKITNQINWVYQLIYKNYHYTFLCADFREALINLPNNHFIYADPPYIDRYNDYYNNWAEQDELDLHKLLSKTSKFLLSTWHSNRYRTNTYIDNLWQNFNLTTTEHFYHLGAKEINRVAINEALIYNFTNDTQIEKKLIELPKIEQPLLFSKVG
ncbi:MAG: Dam family site-specific DNA-(adenine-N6)-methyltransferase [Spirochaetaceae bacterium]|nr:Dam family site-specific DNA-(adenine-N6)-methyltransferase [Spirochaetaceae bacterium]